MGRKILIAISIFFMGLSFANADTTYNFSFNSNDFNSKIAFYNTYETEINELITYWENNFSPEYPYYYLNGLVSDSQPIIWLYYSSSPYIWFNDLPYGASSTAIDIYTDAYDSSGHLVNALFYRNGSISKYNGGSYQAFSPLSSSNLPLISHGILYNYNSFCYHPDLSGSPCEYITYTDFHFPDYTNQNLDIDIESFTITKDDLVPDYLSLYNGSYDPVPEDIYEEIDLNDYSYIILALKDYTPIENQFSTTIYTLGSLCLTPVYDYGMRQKKDYYTDYQVQGCSDYYTTLTPVSIYILPPDVTNHAVYYIKSSNYNITNTIKVNKNIFSISYFTTSNENNPQVIINNRSYPVIPYNDLTDTAIISTDEGYISGLTCAVGDINCQSASMGLDITDIFTNPLKVLQSVWSSITAVFLIISAFMTILPPTLQVFLYTSFMLGFILGIVKIIIG